MTKYGLALIFIFGVGSAAAAQTITEPTTVKTLRPWADYATSQLRDGWDMAQRTDVGFFTWGNDLPSTNMTGKRIIADEFGQTVFRGTPTNNDSSFFLIDPLFISGASLGKVGSNFVINTNQYARLLIKMRMQNEVKPPQFGSLGVPLMQFFWSRDSIYSIHANPQSGRQNGGLLTMVTAAGDQVGIPYGSPDGFANCNGNLRACGTMEGGKYVIHSVPLADSAALAALGTGFNRWKNILDPTAASDVNWGASAAITADSIRIDPTTLDGSVSGRIDIDWVRLVAPGNDTPETISWLGGGEYDLIMSTEADCGASSGNYAVFAYGKSSGFTFHPQAWPNGIYYVGLRDKVIADNSSDTPATRQVRACSGTVGGRYVVLDYPVLTFTSPNPLGSTDDFATVVLNNPWDFNATSDIDLNRNITTSQITTINAERPDGTILGNVRVFRGLSAPGAPEAQFIGDPYSYLLQSGVRGLHNRIDTSRYRLVTMDIGLDAARDLAAGSHLRLIWHIAGETFDVPASPGVPSHVADAEVVSSDLVLRHMRFGGDNVDSLSTRYTLDRVQLDMADRFKVSIESDVGDNVSPSRTGWKNQPAQCAASGCIAGRTQPFDRFGVDNFRLDYHEFTAPTEFFVKEVRLAAHEATTSSFVVSWTYTMPAIPTTGTYADASQWRVRLYAVRTKPETSSGAGDASPMTPNTRVCNAPDPDAFPITNSSTDPTLASGSYTWNSPTLGLVSGGFYFVCAGLILPGDTQPSVFDFPQWPVIYNPLASATLAPRLFLDRTAIRMSARHSGSGSLPNLSSKTPAQTVNITQVGGSSGVGWAIDVCKSYDVNNPNACTGTLDYVQLSRTSGSGTGSFTIQIRDSLQVPQSTAGSTLAIVLRLRETSVGATSNTPQYVQVNIDIFPPSYATSAPFGQTDTPAQNTTGVQGAVGMTGWTLDDVGVSAVRIYRNCITPAENFCETGIVPGQASTPVVFVGVAQFVEGVRPDVEAAFPTYPYAYRAGWGFQILSNMLPRSIGTYAGFGGQGPFTLYAIAVDMEGQSTLLGRDFSDHTPTSITVDNDSIAKPFGVIDTPGQGASTAGTLVNFGWVLTPDSNSSAETGDILMPVDGSTMRVFIDGVAVGSVNYNHCRGNVGTPPPSGVFCDDDVSNIFGNPTPQLTPLQTRTSNPTRFRNLDAGRGPIGFREINTTAMSNGLHALAWGVTDSAGRSEGVGSRNFIVVNGVSDAFEVEAPMFMNPIGHDLGAKVGDLNALARLATGIGYRTGYDVTTPIERSPPSGGVAHVAVRELDRVEVRLPRTLSQFTWEGYQVQHGRLVPLPRGSFLDARSGQFTWQAVAGHFGAYDLLFVRRNAIGAREVLPVRVSFRARFAGPAASVAQDPTDQKR